MDVQDVKLIFLWGQSNSNWKENGMCSRYDEAGVCFIYIYPHSLEYRRLNEALFGVSKSVKRLRIVVVEHLIVTGMDVF